MYQQYSSPTIAEVAAAMGRSPQNIWSYAHDVTVQWLPWGTPVSHIELMWQLRMHPDRILLTDYATIAEVVASIRAADAQQQMEQDNGCGTDTSYFRL